MLALGMLVVPVPGPFWTIGAAPRRETHAEVKRETERKVAQRREATRERQQVRERTRERTQLQARREPSRKGHYEVSEPGREKSFTVARSKAAFASPTRRETHFKDHGKEFNSRSAKAYEQRAARFMGGRTRPGVWQGTRPESRDVVRYDPKTREFGVISREGKIRTYYKLPRNKNETRYFENAWRSEPKRNGPK